MTAQFIGSAYLTVSVIVLLCLAQVSQKPLCINSQTIEKFTMADDSSVYRCSLNRKVPYSPAFVKNRALVEGKVLSFEDWLNRSWNLKPARINVKVSAQPVVTQTQGRTILIWDQSLKNSYQLEIELAKNSLILLQPQVFAENPLALDWMARFVVKIWSNGQEESSGGGLASYLSHQWWNAYEQLRYQQKYRFVVNFPRILKQARSQKFADNETKLYDQMNQIYELFQNQTRFFSLLKNQNSFENGIFTASFDYLILLSSAKPDLFNSLYVLQKNAPGLNLGVWTGESLYHVGSRSQMAASSFAKVKSRNLIWESCDDLELNSLLNIPATVRKLLVVRNCSPETKINYAQYITRGIAGFAASYPQISFVQLDMPSLNMRKDQIALQQKIFDLMAQQVVGRQSQDPFFATFGWQQLQWDHKLQMFFPKANIDAVESFRIVKTN